MEGGSATKTEPAKNVNVTLKKNFWIDSAIIDTMDAEAEAADAKDASRGAISSGTASTMELMAACSFKTIGPIDDANCERATVALADVVA